MANETYEYNIVANFQGSDNNLTIWDSTQHSELNGKYISVVIQLSCVARNTAQNKNGTYSIIFETSSGMFDTQEFEIGTKNVQALKINPDDKFAKILVSSKFANNGVCDTRLIMKKAYSTFSDSVSGEIRGTIKCTIEPMSEEQKQTTSTVGLDKNAVSDWLKTLSVDSMKGGQSATDQYTVQTSFAKGKRTNTLWTNKGVNTNTIDEISISLSGNVLNNASSQRVIDVDVVATGDGDTYTDNMTMEIVPAGRYATFNVEGSYAKADLPNDGNCEFKVIAKNTEDLSGEFVGNIILKGTTVSAVESESTIDDTDVDSIMKSLFGDGYSASDDSDSFMSAYNGLGDSDDKDLMSSDTYKNMGMTDAMAEHLQELEARITALENRMTELQVGGSDVDWYDGGYDGTDDSWGIGDWYEQTDERKSETEEGSEGNVSCGLFECENIYLRAIEDENSYWVYHYGNCVVLSAEAYVIPEMEGKEYQSGSYDLLFSLNGKYRFIVDNWLEDNAIINVGVGCAADWTRIPINFSVSESYVTQKITGTFKDIKGEPVVEDCRLCTDFEAIFPYQTEREKQILLEKIQGDLEFLHGHYLSDGDVFGKITGDIKYTVRDSKESIQEKKTKVTDEQEINVNMTTFDGTQTLFSYDAQNDNKILQSVDLTFTFGYNYGNSQTCVGKKVKLDFNTVAVRSGFPDILTSYPITEDTISASDKQLIVSQKFNSKYFANNGHCKFNIDFSVPGLSAAELADLKQNFTGKIKGTIKYTAVTD